MAKLFPIEGKIQNYAWGGTTYIPNLLSVDKNGEQCAEYWLGGHSKAPSMIKTSEGEKSLDTYIEANLEPVLGHYIAEKFGRLPFLFKVLDVRDMLSIQVHPTKIEAEKGFKKENEAGIPVTAPNRNYKDDNHKPEIMVALSEFWLLHGFLTEAKLKTVLETVPEFNHLKTVFETGGYFGLYKHVMEESQEETNKVLQPLVDRILPEYKAGKIAKSSPDYWAAKAVDSADDASILDKGIYSIYFFNIVKANKGEAVFQDAGIPHAYLEGQNMELMANSDNVLRGGLTPKHVDVPELLKHVAFEETIPNVMKGDLQDDGIERIYKSLAPDFQLSLISLETSKTYKNTAKTAEIIIVIEGEVEAQDADAKVSLEKGQSVLLLAGCEYTIKPKANSVLYKATAPVA
ncbi:mannose-6-phosphate isomerase [Tamlana nanhaiensis]|uniref:mannose-6-phosphate isomerase n=1 Tax=Neotamlana nanhaiensis TaxID=1382798 RepID=A0A0D7W170_9FLAO|nr:mannose-6-phosphate isomerase, class I [Tamlana nanhaiensis]KJD31607.1 mannose-6-phosphate isomerase [Tamlana nanhaiensis]